VHDGWNPRVLRRKEDVEEEHTVLVHCVCGTEDNHLQQIQVCFKAEHVYARRKALAQLSVLSLCHTSQETRWQLSQCTFLPEVVMFYMSGVCENVCVCVCVRVCTCVYVCV
jgi:hypothetical protein